MIIKRNLLLICFLSFGMTNNAIAVSPHDEKTCIEGVNFDIKRVHQLVVEGKEVERYGGWQDKELSITYRDIDISWTKQGTDRFSGRGYKGSNEFLVVNEEDENVQRELKNMLLSRLQVSDDQVADGITIGYRFRKSCLSPTLKQVINVSTLNYQYRKKVKKFEVSKEYFKILNPKAKNVIESICHPKQTICLDKNDKVFLGKYPVKRQCWSEEITYNCKTEPQNGCKHLIDQGYHLYKSSCLDKQEDLCLKWKRYYIKAKAEDGERYTDDEDEFDSSKFGSGGSGSDFDGYDGSSGYGRQRIFDFPRRERSNGGNGMNSDGSDTSDTDGTIKDVKESHASSSNGKNSSFQKYQFIPTKGSSSSGIGGTGGGISGGGVNNGGAMLAGGGSGSKNGKDGEHE